MGSSFMPPKAGRVDKTVGGLVAVFFLLEVLQQNEGLAATKLLILSPPLAGVSG